MLLSHHDKTNSVLPDGPHVAGGGGDGEEERETEQSGTQTSHQAGAQVGRDCLLGGEGNIQPGLGQDIEQQLLAVAGQRHQQHRQQQRQERQHLRGGVFSKMCSLGNFVWKLASVKNLLF